MNSSNNTSDIKAKKPSSNNIHKGHRLRVRNKFMKYGLESFTDVEVLEFLLFHSIPQKDTNPIAHNLLNEFGSLRGVMAADINDLMNVNGISEISASLIVFYHELHKYIRVNALYDDISIHTTHLAGRFCCNYFYEHINESLILISLDSNKIIKCVDVVSKGIENITPFYLRQILRLALKNKASMVVLAHNHPNENPTPSSNDVVCTKKIAKILADADIPLVDHIICSGDGYTSLSDQGYLDGTK